jgi:lipopolysaccharide/colanic/teichoic acid biosynthesis glycosyltransferase/glycosyltransferase involved in cell wall biosynthesis
MKLEPPRTAARCELRCSVVVPVYNGAATIMRCLAGLAQQTAAADSFEVLVVDAGCDDATPQLVRDWQQTPGAPALRYLRLGGPAPSLAAARNFGVQHAQAPVVLFTEADCAPGPGWVQALLQAFDDERVMGARGAFRTEQSSLVPRFVQVEYEDRYDRARGRDQIDFIDNYSAAYRREVFLANGGFDVAFGACEDQELSFRLAEKGYRLVFVPQAVVTHLHDTRLLDYMRRKYAQGFWKAPLTQLHPDRMVQDTHTPQVLKLQIVLLSLLLALLPAALLGLWWPPLDWLWLPVAAAGLLFLLSAAPFLVKLARRSGGLALAGPGMLACRALALGGGYLAGTVHFAGALPGARRPVIPGWKRVVKRGIDIAGALIGLAFAIPLVAVAAVAIKLDSPGPIFFGQVRIGENGRRFRIFKLRSMVRDAERQLDALVDLGALGDEPAFKLRDDPRVTRVGRILRRTSLDEVPQFYNVLRGDMSLVGPRPEEERVVALYTDQHRQRLAVKPGLTGPMQVSGRGNLSFSERLQLELEYIEHYSLRRDLSILLRTVPVLLHGKGAR